MRIRIAVPEAFASPPVIDAALEAVTRLNEHMIRSGQTPTSRELIAQGAVWRPENMGDEHFDHGGTIASRGWGDCDDWAPLHAATLRASGEDPGAFARVVPSGPNTYHAIVQRTDGAIDDPSIAAGMKATRVSGVDPDRIQLWAEDPHDGRVYQGQLLPTTGPLGLHCGTNLSVRAATVVGAGTLYQARCDLPINGSPLVHVRSYLRHRPHHHHGRKRVRGAEPITVVGGHVPYALSCTSYGASAHQALNDAICGAILCGDAAELTTSLDRYKLLAMQGAMAGMSPGQVHEALKNALLQDLTQHANTTGQHPTVHSQRLLAQLAQEGAIHGNAIVVGDIFSDIGHIASGVVDAVSDVASSVAKAAGSIPWGDILHSVQAAVSVVPGLGTAVSDVLAAAETAYDAAAAALHGNPLEAAIHAAYNFALASIPGAAAIRLILDPVVDTLIRLTAGKEPIDSAVLNGLLDSVPDVPKFGAISPRSVAASLAHLVVGHVGVKATPGPPRPPPPPPPPPPPSPELLARMNFITQRMGQITQLNRARQAAAAAAAKKPPPPPAPKQVIHFKPPPAPPKPPGVPHAAVHVATAPKAPPKPRPHPHAPPTPARPPVAPPHVVTPPHVVAPPPVAHPPPAAARAAAAPHAPGAPPGTTHWFCTPGPGGSWQCRWA